MAAERKAAKAADVLKLTVFPPEWGLPSADARSLEAMVYASLARLPVEVQSSVYPYASPTGSLPALQHNTTVVDARGLVAYMRETLCDLDAKARLSKAEAAASEAFATLINERLYPATLYMMWVVDSNYSEVTSQFYARDVKFPVRLVLPLMERWRVKDELAARGITSEAVAMKTIRHCYTLLARHLEGRNFLFSRDRPCRADAAAAAHIAVHYHCPLPVGGLKKTLQDEFPVLERHFQRVLSQCVDYDPSVSLEVSEQDRKEFEERLSVYSSAAAPAGAGEAEQPLSGRPSKLRAKSAGEAEKETRKLSKDELEVQRQNRYFIGIAIGSLLAYGILARLSISK